MLGKASEIKVWLVVETVNQNIEKEIESTLGAHPNWEVIDIKFSMMQNGEKVNDVYHEALIIYKEAE